MCVVLAAMLVLGNWWSLRYQGHRWGFKLARSGGLVHFAGTEEHLYFYITPDGNIVRTDENTTEWDVIPGDALSWKFAFRTRFKQKGGIDLGNPDIQTSYLRIPPWALVLPVAIPTAWCWRRDRRHPPGHCAECGYDLTGLTEPRCPECNREFDPKTEEPAK